jgi:thiamine-phosphate pyrophosphorylase
MGDFKVIVYSAEVHIKDEVFYINDLLAAGVQQLHLRKPSTPKYVLENLLVNIDPRQHHKLVVHNHYDLLDKYNLKGIHLTQKYLEKAHPLNVSTIINTAKVKQYTLSRPLHSLAELATIEDYYDFVTLSPVFNSISKTGYEGKKNEFANLLNYKKTDLDVYALGGIDQSNILQTKEMGFDGAVVLGAIWKSTDPTTTYKEIINSVYQIG